MPSSENRIFVSYSHQNCDWARRLRFHEDPKAIESASFWIDHNRLAPGDYWTDKVRSAIKSASAVVLLVSKDSLESAAVRKELRYILKRYRKDRLQVVFVPIGKLKPRHVGKVLALERVDELLSVPGWEHALHERADQERRSVEELRARIVAAATEQIDVQSLRKSLPPKYVLDRKLNRGPLARILRAKDVSLDRHVVIKVLHQRNARHLFRESVERVAKVPNHTNVMPVYEAYLDSEPPFYMLEYIDGVSLRHLFANEGAAGFNLSFVQYFIRQVGAAVAHAHRYGIAGLNIKPSNIMVRDYDRPAQRTFYLGLSSYDETVLVEREIADDAYKPPECLGGGRSPGGADAMAADQYRLGVLAYEALAGERRFAPLARARAESGADQPWPRVQEACPECLDFVAAVVDRMLSVDPGQRYPSVADAVGSLDTDLQIEIVRASYRRIMATDTSQHDFSKRFYLRFQRDYPVSREIFASRFGDLGDGDADSAAWRRQFQALKEAVLLLVVYHAMGEQRRRPNILTRIAERHAAMNVMPGLYEPFARVLVETIVEADRDANVDRRRLHAAWTAAVRDGIRYMKEETERIQAGLVSA